jgi:hypothetical protein
MSFADRLKHAAQNTGLWAETPDQPAPQPVPAAVATATFPSAAPATPTAWMNNPTLTVSPSVPAVAPDQEIVAGLVETINKSKLPGYTAFKTIFDAMVGIPDTQRYALALNATAASSHITIDDVVASLDEKLSLLDADAKSFEAAFQESLKSNVGAAQDEIQHIAETVEAKKQEIRDLDAKRVSLTEKMGAAQVNLEKEHATFGVSFDAVRSSLAAERDRIKTIASYTTQKPSTPVQAK